MHTPIKGFSKLSKEAKIEWISNEMFENPEQAWNTLKSYWHTDGAVQKLHDDFIENTITNYFLPFGVAPNFLINGKHYAIPMAIEESSVVAAASKSAQFWMKRGGFKTSIISTTKIGHVHFIYTGDEEKLYRFFKEVQPKLEAGTAELTANMRARGGGILSTALINKSDELEGYYQIETRFETCDSMGANFINSCLEQFAKIMQQEIGLTDYMSDAEKSIQIVMCILSNYTPECLVRAEVSCAIEDLNADEGITPIEFAEKFLIASSILTLSYFFI